MASAGSDAQSNNLVHRTPFFYGWIVWAVGTLGYMATSPGQSFSVSLFFDHFIADLGLSRTVVSSMYAIGTLIASFSLTYVGHLIDRYGNRKAGVGISALLAVALIGMSFVTGPVMLVFGFILIRGLGQGSMTLNSGTSITNWFRNRRGFVMGLTIFLYMQFQSFYVLGVNSLIGSIGWRPAWIVLSIGIAVTILPASLFLMRDKPEKFGLTTDGVSDNSEVGWLENLLGRRSADEAEDNWTLKETMRTPMFWVITLAVVCNSSFVTGLIIHQTSLFGVVGHEPQIAVNTYARATTIAAWMTLIGGPIVNRMKPGLVVSLQMTMLISALGLSMFMTAPWMTWLYSFLLGAPMGIGFVFGGIVWPNLFGREHQGAIRGLVSTIAVAGSAAGPILFSLSYDAIGTYNITLTAAMIFAAIPLLGGLLVKAPIRQVAEAGS